MCVCVCVSAIHYIHHIYTEIWFNEETVQLWLQIKQLFCPLFYSGSQNPLCIWFICRQAESYWDYGACEYWYVHITVQCRTKSLHVCFFYHNHFIILYMIYDTCYAYWWLNSPDVLYLQRMCRMSGSEARDIIGAFNIHADKVKALEYIKRYEQRFTNYGSYLILLNM